MFYTQHKLCVLLLWLAVMLAIACENKKDAEFADDYGSIDERLAGSGDHRSNGKCADTPGYVDAAGWWCQDWVGYDCNTATDYYGFTNQQEQALKNNCQKSCGLCQDGGGGTGGGTNNCVDSNQYCSYWASVGECSKNPGYMLTYCCASCNGGGGGNGGNGGDDGATQGVDAFLGQYERTPVTNNWHKVNVILKNNNLRWKNAAGVSWSLTYAGGVLKSGSDCVYGRQTIQVVRQSGAVTALVFNGEQYHKIGGGGTGGESGGGNGDDGSGGGGGDDGGGGGGNDGDGGGAQTVYTTESAPDLDTSDRLDFKNGLHGYQNLGDTKRCTLSQFNSLLGRKDIKTLYHSSHGFNGGVALMNDNLTCDNSATYQVENVIYATCLTLQNTCWKKKMGSTSRNILGYTNVSYDGIANQNAKKFANNINSGMSYVRAWYASNTAINALKDRWCAYVREGNGIVEYSARSGKIPKYPANLEPAHADEIVFIDPSLLEDTRDFDESFSSLNTASYLTDSGQEPTTIFYNTNSSFLQKVGGLEPGNTAQRAQELKDTLPDDAALESIAPIEADGAVVAHRIRYIRTKDNLEIRTNGYEHHVEVIVNGDQVVSRSEFWPVIEVLYQSKMRKASLLTVQETVRQLADELVSIVRNSVAIIDVRPCYGSGGTGELVPAHCFTDTVGTTWVIDALNGDLVE